jgi:hypothetical protein
VALHSRLMAVPPEGPAMVLPGELRFAVPSSSPIEVIRSVRQFLDEALLAHVEANEKGTCHVLATAFIDSVPLHIEVCAIADGEDVSVVFKHPSQNDIIRFKQLYERFVAFFQSLNMQVTTSQQAITGAWSGLIDDDFDSDDDSVTDDVHSWPERVDLVLADAISSVATIREQAFQCLARWSASAPASHEAMAQGLARYASQLGLTLLASLLAEMYPASSMLKNVACSTSPEAQKILSDSEFFTVLTSLEVSMLPSLVTSNLTLAVQSLRKVSDEKQCREKVDISGNSTRCTSIASSPDFGSMESSETSTLGAVKREVRCKPSVMLDTTFMPEPLQFYNLADNLFHECSD